MSEINQNEQNNTTFLPQCPKTPNCVSTENKDLNRFMLPISYDGLTMDEAKEAMTKVIEDMPKMEVIKVAGEKIEAVAKTMVMEFYHDVLFYFDDNKKEIHFRSASRFGLTDFGSNKRRMQRVTAQFMRKRDEKTKN